MTTYSMEYVRPYQKRQHSTTEENRQRQKNTPRQRQCSQRLGCHGLNPLHLETKCAWPEAVMNHSPCSTWLQMVICWFLVRTWLPQVAFSRSSILARPTMHTGTDMESKKARTNTWVGSLRVSMQQDLGNANLTL